MTGWQYLAVAALLEAPPITLDQLRSLPPNQAARSFLPPQAAATIVTIRAMPDGMLPGGIWLTLATEPRSVGTTLCRREEYHFLARENRDGTISASSERIDPSPALKISNDCSDSADTQFASVPRAETDGAAQVLEWLHDVREQARAGWRTPTSISCKSKAKPARCTSGARKAFAQLPLELAWNIHRANEQPAQWELWISEVERSAPGGILWTVTVDRSRATPKIRMLWHYPAPF